MVKCLECGFESKRLQWTHFKYNCTGKFKNGREYRTKYPNAKLVDDDLANSTAITQENFIKKYGEKEGQQRWKSYREKQAYSNTYEYKSKKYGWTQDQFKCYNQSRAQTLEKMILRYGEIEGAAQWEKYCLRQAYTNTKEYFIEKYGLEKGLDRYLLVNQKKSIPHTPELLAQHLNISIDEATDIIIRRQSNFYISNLEREFTKEIEQRIGKLDHISSRNPFGLWSKELNTYVVYDIKHKDAIIEFNGDYWHANPLIYAESAIIRGSTAAKIRERDRLKIKTAIDRGLRPMTIWELEFKNDRKMSIEKAIKWILNESN